MMAFSRRFICQLLIVSIATLPFSAQTRAALIATDQVVASDQASGERDKLRDFVARADVRNQLAALGASPAAAMDRVNALTAMRSPGSCLSADDDQNTCCDGENSHRSAQPRETEMHQRYQSSQDEPDGQ